jgi:hypothetical protein
MIRRSRGLSLLLGATLLTGGCAQEPGSDEEMPALGEAARSDPWPEAIIREVLAMEQADQRIRQTINALFRANQPDTAALRRATAEQQALDAANTTRLEAIIREHGWPSKADVGSPAASAAFLIAQHSDHDLPFQKEYLAFVEQEFAKGQAPGDAVALLTDRTRLAEGQPQLYGTQISIENGRLVIQPMENEAEVDQRRATLGLGPHSEYVARVKQAYGMPE